MTDNERELMVLNVLPIHAVLYPRYSRSPDPKLSSQIFLKIATGANFTDSFFCKFGMFIVRTVRQGAMATRIVHVLLRRCPSKVLKAIVERIAIAMRGNMGFAWGRTNKYLKNKAIHPARDNLAIISDDVGAHIIPIGAPVGRCKNMSRRNAARPLHQPLNATEIANRICQRERYRFPNFIGIIDFIHSAVLSRSGQGRAVFAAPFRPANSSHFCGLTQ